MKSTSFRLDRDVVMPMRDGTKLRADIYRASDRKQHPAIFIRTPYDKRLNSWHHSSFLHFIDATRQGYAVVIQDVRGRFASEGQWGGSNIFLHEGTDGYDSVEWIAAQPWCDGNVGMSGISALSALQYMTAMENPPHLKAIAPGCGGMANLGVGMQPRYSSGAVSPAVLLSSIPGNSLEVANRLEKQGQDVSEMRQAIHWVQSNPERALNYLPLLDLPIFKFEHMRNTWDILVRPLSQTEQDRRQKYHKIKVPCLHSAGWYDYLEWSAVGSYCKMRKSGGSAAARQNQHLIVGPWWHTVWGDSLGALNFSPAADIQRGGISDLHLAFYDRYLLGKDIQIPRVTYFAMGRNLWQEADDWPLPQTRWQRYYLSSQGKANTSAGDGVLSRDEPRSKAADSFSYDPLYPVPTLGGRFFGAGLVPGPLDQSNIEKRPDVLCYTSEELKEDLEVTGPLEVHLFARTSAKDTDFTAKLVDVYADGSAYNLAEGIKRSRAIKSAEKPEFIVPGEIYEYVILLGDTSQVFRQGHRIRLEISSSNFPMFDRNMNTGHSVGVDASGEIARQTVYHERGHASYIDLPVI
jgi:uncharacterized protein